MVNFLDVSLWPVLIAAGINFGVGMLWYGPFFGKPWMGYVGFKEEDKEQMQKAAGPAYGASLISSLLFGYVMDLLINLTGIQSLLGALVLALIIWLCIQIPTAIKPAIWEGKPRGLFFINSGYELVIILLISIGAFFL